MCSALGTRLDQFTCGVEPAHLELLLRNFRHVHAQPEALETDQASIAKCTTVDVAKPTLEQRILTRFG
jgi:hypothetical protein